MNTGENIYKKRKNVRSRMASFENPTGAKGAGGQENHGAKGRALRKFYRGDAVTLMDTDGPGVINRMWITLKDRSPEVLRAVVLECYWDNEEKPAVSVPLGDFFLTAYADPVACDTVYISNPEGRSFVSHFKMPFYTHARVVLKNESDRDIVNLFYDITYELCDMEADQMLYFHSFWNCEHPVGLAKDYTVLPSLRGEGKYIGAFFAVRADKQYENTWFGEGEIKIYLDGDTDYPTICGTGTEDYIGTGWGQGAYGNRTQGSLVADRDNGLFHFYRFHADDPVYFYEDIKIQLQNIGGASVEDIRRLIANGASLDIVTCDTDGELEHLYKTGFILPPDKDTGWYNFYRQDNFESVAYFYYDKPVSDLPVLPDAETRKLLP